MAVKSCVVCGFPIQVSGMETQATCKQCGSIYDVLIHGAVSPEVGLTAEKKPSLFVGPNLIDEAGVSVINTTQYIGTRICFWARLVDETLLPHPPGLGGRSCRIMRKVGAEAWKKFADVRTDADGYVNYWFRLTDPGAHKYRIEWDGDDVYYGCPSKVHGLAVDSAVSPEVGVVAAPALTVQVKNLVTKKPVAGAVVLVNAYESVTDEIGVAVFDYIPAGSYVIRVTAPGYIESSKRVELTEAGAVVEISLMPIWVIPTGVAVVGGLVLVGTKAMKWW